MISPQFIGQTYRNTLNGDVWQANSLTPGDWTKIAGAGGGGSNLDGAGDPTGVVTPDYVGQYYRDTSTGNIWKSTGATSADWSLQVQDSGFAWNPTSVKLLSATGFITTWWGSDCLPGVTNLVLDFKNQASYDSIHIDSPIDLETLNIKNLPSVSNGADLVVKKGSSLVSFICDELTNFGSGGIAITDLVNLLSISLKNLENCEGGLVITGCASLNSLDLSALVTSQITVSSCPALQTIVLPLWLPQNAVHGFTGLGLNLASVDNILARGVANAEFTSGTIDLRGGTSVTPTTGEGSAHDILEARGVTVYHN